MIALDASALRMHPGSVKVVVHAQAATSHTRGVTLGCCHTSSLVVQTNIFSTACKKIIKC